MKFWLRAIYTLLFVLSAAASTCACAVPKDFFFALFDADAIVRGTIKAYEIYAPGHEARLKIEVQETLKGNIQPGPLSVAWMRDEPPTTRWTGGDIIVALKYMNQQNGGEYEVVHGCMCWFPRRTEPVFPPRSEPPLSMVF